MNLSKHELVEATLAATAKHGFYLTHAAIQALPVEITHDQAKNMASTEQ
jgi:hypothetical protein